MALIEVMTWVPMYDKHGRWIGPVEPEIPPPDYVLIGSRFRNGRQMAGMSQRSLARRAGISQSVVSRFERGLVRYMSADRIVRMALALGPKFPFGACPHDHVCVWPHDPSSPRSPKIGLLGY